MTEETLATYLTSWSLSLLIYEMQEQKGFYLYNSGSVCCKKIHIRLLEFTVGCRVKIQCTLATTINIRELI